MEGLQYERIAERFAAQRILVAGDLMLDEFLWGKVSRISPEAPVPVVDVTAESYYPGGAANVARNIREFTAHASVMGMAGADPYGDRLVSLLHGSGIETTGVLQHASSFTTVKTRWSGWIESGTRRRQRSRPSGRWRIWHRRSRWWTQS